MNVVPRGGFGTVCSSLVELREDGGVSWLFAAGAPDEVGFELVALGEAAGRFGRQRERSTAEDAEHTEVRARLVWPVRHAGKQAR
jgi:hypothetical protein